MISILSATIATGHRQHHVGLAWLLHITSRGVGRGSIVGIAVYSCSEKFSCRTAPRPTPATGPLFRWILILLHRHFLGSMTNAGAQILVGTRMSAPMCRNSSVSKELGSLFKGSALFTMRMVSFTTIRGWGWVGHAKQLRQSKLPWHPSMRARWLT